MGKTIWIIAIIIILLIITSVILFSGSDTSDTDTGTTQESNTPALAEYTDLQTDNDVFNTIDESLDLLE